MSIFSDFDATYGGGIYTGVPTQDGGTDIFHNGTVVEHMQPSDGDITTGFTPNGDLVIQTTNDDGTTDTYINGKHVQHTHKNIFGGQTTYDENNHVDSQSIPNSLGGVNVYDDNMQPEGMSTSNIFGSETYFANDDNFDNVMQYDDPLSHVTEYQMTPFDASKTY